MSVSPSGSPPRRALHERSNSQNNSQNNRLGIRLVPYSPPRVASDGTVTSSKTITQADANTETDTELDQSQACSPSHSYSPQLETPSPSLQRTRARTTVASPSPLKGPTRYPSSDFEPSQSSWTPHYDTEADDQASYASRPPSRGPSASPRPASRKKVIKVNPDKTFSVQYHNASMSSRVESLWSLPPSFTTGNTSYGRESIGTQGTIGEDRQSRPASPLTPLAEREPSSPIISSRTQDPSTPDTSSPWNYRLFGGLRKVPKTPDVKQKQPQAQDAPPELPLPTLPEVDLPIPEAGPSSKWLNEKTSFHSSSSDQTRTTVSERTNIKTYGQSSPVNVADLRSLPPSSIHSNIELIGDPSSAEASLYASTRPPTEDSNVNFVTHGSRGSHSASSSVVAVRHRVQPEFSQESLVVAPLQPRKRRSSDTFALARCRSRDTIRSRSASITSLSTIFTQEATRALFVGPPTVLQHAGPSWHDLQNRPQSRPHQWSGQLSTVMSESEGGSSEPASRALSLSSVPRRRGSDHSKHVLSMTSSLFGLEEHIESPSPSRGNTPSHSRNNSLEPPSATYARNSARDPATGTIRLVRDHDEDGDGLADLEVLHHRSSRTRLGRFLSSHASDRSLRSTASFNAAVPAWAKVYYGSGERKWLAAQPSMESMYDSDFNDSELHEPQLSRSPSQDANATNIRNPRRRPRDLFPRQHSATGSMGVSAAPAHPVMAVVRNIKKQTSSIWSPHLARDRRPAQISIWQPPASEWESRSELTGRRNAQVTMFVVGFVFPLAWMLAAFIPIKAASTETDDSERNNSTSKLDGTQVNGREDAVFTSAIWWRKVNRGMSIIGLLILGAIIALIVIGVKQRWGQ